MAGMNQLKQMGVRVIVNMTSRNETTVPWKIPRETLEKEGFTFYDWPIEKEAFSIDQLLSKYATYEKGGVHVSLIHHLAISTLLTNLSSLFHKTTSSFSTMDQDSSVIFMISLKNVQTMESSYTAHLVKTGLEPSLPSYFSLLDFRIQP